MRETVKVSTHNFLGGLMLRRARWRRFGARKASGSVRGRLFFIVNENEREKGVPVSESVHPLAQELCDTWKAGG
jgi:hypothetical protein